MSLKSKIEAVIYASEEPVTLAQIVGVLAGEAQAELDALAARQRELPLQTDDADEQPAEPVAEIAVESTVDAVPDERGDEADPNVSTDVPEGAENGDAVSDPGETTPSAPDALQQIDVEEQKRLTREREKNVREYLRDVVDALIRDYAESDRGIEVREVAGGFRMATKPEYHDAVRGFVKSLKPALKLSLQALETLAVVAYKQPVTAAEISEIRGVDSAGVLGGLLTRKLIQTAGRKQVIGRPMLYKTSKEFLVRFGLKDIHELPSMEEFERMAGELNEQEDLPIEPAESLIERANARGDVERIQQEVQEVAEQTSDRTEGTTLPLAGSDGGNNHSEGSQMPGETTQEETASVRKPEEGTEA